MSDALQASGVYWLAGLLGLLVLGQRLLKKSCDAPALG